ncbi:MAG TPA: acetylxylan esterase [Terriglobia bacterium]|jgi:cephalosporin-C deacetylase-like acetyl esterase|nr:acetylxylan esterase [Terriglobia bacterium]
MDRRDFVKQAGILPLAVGLPGGSLAVPSGKPPQASAARLYSQMMPDMLVTYLTEKVNAMAAHWDQQRAQIRTPGQMEARNRFVRQKCIEMIHGFPKRNPLNPIIVKSFERDGYKVENLMYESQPDFWVTGNLYIPTSGSGPYPGIISPCGHYPTARGFPEYQAAYVNFARNGFVVLAYDPIGEGERRHFWNPMTHVNEIGGPVTWEHSLPGQLLLLIGEDLTHYRVWDGMRAIDYLLTRPEVDGKRIGCAGHSGGGTLTKFIAAMDERVACAAINEGGTANEWPIHIPMYKPMGTGDTEQHMFPSGTYGIDNVDLLAAVAPRPLLVTIEHYAPPFNRAAAAILARYELLGAGDKFKTVPADDPHAWTVKLRIANTDWFSRWFYNRPGPQSEAPFTPEPWENLWCTVDGSIEYSRQGQTIYSLILKTQATLPPERKAPTSSSELVSYRSELGEEIRKVIRYRPSNTPLAPRHDTTTPRKGYKIEKLEFLSEPGIYIPTWVYKPDAGVKNRTAILYVSDTGRVEDGMEFGLLEQLTLQGNCVVAVDVRGMGATTPPHLGEEHGEFRQVDDTECTMTYMAWEINEDLFGMRVLDVIRSIDYVLSRPDVDPTGVRLAGRGAGALWSLYAAALDTRVKILLAHEGLLSYRALTSVDRYLTESSLFIRNVLTRFDLPQVAAAVAERPLAVLAPRGPMKEAVDMGAARRAYHWTEQVYGNLGIKDRFQVSVMSPDKSLADQYLELLRIS